jgi:hypothetical protein
MDRTERYANILTQVLRKETKVQPSLQPGLKIVSSCDRETGQFLLIIVGWDRDEWYHSILFHAQLVNGKIIVEADMTEEGLKPLLIEAGIREEDFLSDEERDWLEAERVAA